MKNRFMRGAALGLAMVTAFTFTAPNSALLSAEAAAKQATAATKITAKAASVKVGKTAKVKVTINKKATKKVTINVKAKNAKIAKVAKKLTIKKGKKAATLKVKGLKKGSTKLTLSFKNSKGKTVKKTIKVTVKKAAAAKVAATGVTFGKNAYSVGIGQTATLDYTVVPANTTDTATWTSSDETVATVANGVVTGVKEGKATITVAFNENVTASAEVTVSKDAIVYNLTGVKQIAANKVELTFDNEHAANLTSKDDIAINNASTTVRHHINNFTWSADGKVAIAEVATPFVDKAEYNVVFKSAEPQKFTASVGEVASVVVKTASAEKEKATLIEYSLLDANQIDVTSTVDLNNKVTISTDKGSLGNSSNKAKTTIKLTTIGDVANVTVTYKIGSGKDPIVGTGVITCIDNTAIVGTGVFAVTNDTNSKSKCAKFYKGLSDTIVNMATNDGDLDNLYFTAIGEDGRAVDYDKYEISSSDDTVIKASIKSNKSGKFTQIKVTPKAEGSANVLINATSYGKVTSYAIPVQVQAKAELSNITVEANKETISNAYDEDYYGTITVTGYDSLGREIDLTDAKIKLSSDDDVIPVVSDKAAGVVIKGKVGDAKKASYGFVYDNQTSFATSVPKGSVTGLEDTNDNGHKVRKFYYNAWGANEDNNMNLTVSAKASGKTEEDDISISIDMLPDEAWNAWGNDWRAAGRTAGTGVDVTYGIDLSDEEVDLAELKGSVSAKLYASVGNTFAGYVRNNNINVETGAAVVGGLNTSGAATAGLTGYPTSGGAVAVKTDSCITSIRQGVKGLGSDYAVPVAPAGSYAKNQRFYLYNSNVNVNTSETVAVSSSTASVKAEITADTIDRSTTALSYAVGGSAEDQLDVSFAREGSYEVWYKYYMIGADGEPTSTLDDISESFSIVNSLSNYAPEVEYESLNMDKLTTSDVIKTLYTNVDMNNSKTYSSIKGLYTFEGNDSAFDLTQFDPAKKDSNTIDVDYVVVEDEIVVHPDKTGSDKATINYYVSFNHNFVKN